MSTAPLSIEELLRHRAWVRSLARRLVQDQAAVDDLVQDAWLAALEAGPSVPARARAWLGGVLRNLARQRHRSENRRSSSEDRATALEPQPSAHELAAQAEEERRLVSAVLALPEADREVVLLRYFAGLSSAQIARREDIPESTVRNRLKRALDALRERLDRESKGDRRAWCLGLVRLAAPRSAGAGVGVGVVATIAAVIAIGLGLASYYTVLVAREHADAARVAMMVAIQAREDNVRAAELAQAGSVATVAASSGELSTRAAVPTDTSAAASNASGQSMRVRVVSPEKQAIPGARVTFDGREYLAGADGVVTLPLQGPEVELVRLGADAPGYFHRRVDCSTLPELALELPRVRSIAGRVFDLESRAPLAGARVSFHHNQCKGCEPEITTTDSRGAFSFDRVPIGWAISLGFSSDPYPESYRSFTLSQDSAATCEILLDRGVELRGRVSDPQTGRPLGGARISHHRGGNARARTDERGLFMLRVERPIDGKTVDLHAAAAGYCGLSTSAPYPSADAGALVELPLVRSASIEGYIRDETGQPLPGATVVQRSRWGSGSVLFPPLRAAYETGLGVQIDVADDASLTNDDSAGGWVKTSDERGFFRIDGVIPWERDCSISASARGYVAGERKLGAPLAPGETRAVSITLALGGAIEGRLSLNGQPTAGYVICGRPGPNHAKTDRAGHFLIDGLVPGRVLLSGVAGTEEPHGDNIAPGSGIEIDVRAGETVHQDIDLHVAFANVRGRVTRSDGTAVQGAYVLAISEDRARKRVGASTDEEGEYTLALPADRTAYSIIVENAPMHKGVVPGAERIDFVQASQGRIHLRARDASTQELVTSCINAAWRPAGEIEYRELPDLTAGSPTLDGLFTLELPAGTLDLVIFDAVHAPVWRSGVVVNPVGAPLLLEVELEPSRSVAVRLAEGQAALPSECAVFVVEVESTAVGAAAPDETGHPNVPRHLMRSRHLRFDKQGVATIGQLGLGKYCFASIDGALTFDPAEFEVPAAPPKPVELRWRRASDR